MDISEVFESTAFYVLTGVGYFVMAFMIIALKQMGNADIMPWWVKVLAFIIIPVVAALFSGYAEG